MCTTLRVEVHVHVCNSSFQDLVRYFQHLFYTNHKFGNRTFVLGSIDFFSFRWVQSCAIGKFNQTRSMNWCLIEFDWVRLKFSLFEFDLLCQIIHISIYTLSDLGVLSNLIGSLSLANEHYSPPTEWIMRKPNKNKMAGVNSSFASVSESIFNGFLLKILLRSLPVYILKQLFFSISVNSGRIFTSPLRGSVNILPLFTSISKNNC